MYSMVTIVNNTELYSEKSLSEQIFKILITHTQNVTDYVW